MLISEVTARLEAKKVFICKHNRKYCSID